MTGSPWMTGSARTPRTWSPVVEGKRGEKVREVHMQPGERWTEQKYHEMNVALPEPGAGAAAASWPSEDEPFFLQYWPGHPPVQLHAHTVDKFTTPNGGTYVEKMKLLDRLGG